MTAVHLVRLYPRAWRERYGEEFVQTIGDEALHLQQIIDIVAGAIDAWLSPAVRRQARAATTSTEGASMDTALKSICRSKSLRYSNRDALIGAAIMLAGSLLMVVAGLLLERRGFELAGEMLVTNAFMVSLMLSMPFWIMKGQPWRAQAVLIGGTTLFLAGISYVAYLI